MIPTLRTTTVLDRVGLKRSDEAYLTGVRNAANARFLVLADAKPVIISNEAKSIAQIRWFTQDELQSLGLPTADALFLGIDRVSGAGHFAIAVSEHRAKNAPGGAAIMRPLVDLRTLAMQGIMSADDVSLIGQAKSLTHWHESAHCCGRCGGTTMSKDGGWKRKCWACGQEHFPRTDPVVIMLVTDGERCLLGHEARFQKEPRMYSTLAGFIEPGEDLEHAVRREIFEEAGLEVGEVRYHSCQPWPFPHSLMLGALGMATTTEINIDTNEIEEARWFSKDEIRQMLEKRHPGNFWVPGQQAIACALIQAFVDGWWK